MFKKILIANRGEVAMRIVRACGELGIGTAIAHSTADADSMPISYAGSSVCIGSAPASQSYLLGERVIAAANIVGADAVHPGYGFLSEDASFARMSEEAGLAFIGPSAESIALMGDKVVARAAMEKHGIPIVPGSDGTVESLAVALDAAGAVGYPVVMKPSAGGGGKGMREVANSDELKACFDLAVAEAQAACGDGSMYIEKLIERPRHVEVQVMADCQGNAVALCERNCSVQRRHQKLIEESPSPHLPEGVRVALRDAALDVVRAAGYRTVGTVEFLLDDDDKFYFLEMNTRLQVEHPVTEQVTGIDIVKEQIRLAAGESLGDVSASMVHNGHAIEFRVNAEDPTRGFCPCPGRITRFELPGGPGVRVDTFLRAGDVVAPYYDSLIAKLVVWGRDRDEALVRSRRALDEFVVEGIDTTIPFLRRVLNSVTFREGRVSTDFIDRELGAMAWGN